MGPYFSLYDHMGKLGPGLPFSHVIRYSRHHPGFPGFSSPLSTELLDQYLTFYSSLTTFVGTHRVSSRLSLSIFKFNPFSITSSFTFTISNVLSPLLTLSPPQL